MEHGNLQRTSVDQARRIDITRRNGSPDDLGPDSAPDSIGSGDGLPSKELVVAPDEARGIPLNPDAA